jgi:hypothetical protein
MGLPGETASDGQRDGNTLWRVRTEKFVITILKLLLLFTTIFTIYVSVLGLTSRLWLSEHNLSNASRIKKTALSH